MLTAEEVIAHYKLEPLDQEGGFFRQVWKSGLLVNNDTLCERYPDEGTHPMGTLIYFLITTDSFSAMHRLPTAEHWFFHMGDPLEMLLLHGDGRGEIAMLGTDLKAGQQVQLTVPMDSWQGTRIAEGADEYGWSLGSCVMVPGFEWTDFELGDRSLLIKEYPEHAAAIERRTRETPVQGSL
ncbi:MAG: cupin domain-containing protein [Verrucomicrobiota bacterium]